MVTSASSDGGPSLTVAAVARRLGVAPATLRTWDRRYGLGPSEHLAGSHRRYSSADVARLLVMRRLTLEGVAPSEAARTALDSAEGPVTTAPGPTTAEVMDAYSDAVPMAADPAALIAAAGHFDHAAVRWMLSRVQPRDVVSWWTDLVQPALALFNERSVLERPGESAGPALFNAAFAELRSRAAVAASRIPADVDEAPAVLVIGSAGTPDLLAHVLATAVQDQGVPARVLSGGRASSVAGALERVRPAAVVVHVDAEDDGTGPARAVVEAVVAVDPDLPVFVHREGGGAVDVPVSAAVHRVRSLPGTVHELLAAVD